MDRCLERRHDPRVRPRRGAGKGKVVASLKPLGLSGYISGLAHDGKLGLYVANFGADRTGQVHFDLTANRMTTDRGVPGEPIFDVFFDRRDGSVHFGASRGNYYRIAKFGAHVPAQLVVNIPSVGGVFAHLVVNDLRARTSAFPRAIEASKGGVLELAAHGDANRPALVFLSSVNTTTIPPLQIAGGSTSAAGFFTAPRLSIPGNLAPATVGFRSATLTAGNRIELGSEVRVDIR